MTRTPLTDDERWAALSRQVGFLYRSIKMAVQDGVDDEAVRVATAVRVLVHDTRHRDGTPSSVSLLTQLGLKEKLKYLDTRPGPTVTAIIAEDYVGAGANTDQEDERGLAVAEGSPMRWVAPLDRAPHDNARLGFADWWKTSFIPVQFDDTEQFSRISRYDLMTFMVHHDGGAHVDPRGLDDRYRSLVVTGGRTTFWIALDAPMSGPEDMPDRFRPDQIRLPEGNAASATMVQAGYELFTTMRDSGLCQRVWDT